MADKKKKLTKELNLGLTEILSKDQPAKASDKTADQGPASPETSIVTFDDNLDGLSPELSALAERKQWGILVSRAETSIASEEDIEARLWWVRGHLGALTLPVSLLAAPFETVCRQLIGDTRVPLFRSLLKEIGDIMIDRLHGVGDRRQEHSVRIVLCQLGILEPDDKSARTYGKVPPKVPRFELGDYGAVEQVEAPASNFVSRSRKRRAVELGALAVILLLLSGGFYLWRAYVGEPRLLVADEDLLGTDQNPSTQQPPLLARHVSSNLGAIYYSLNDREGGAEDRNNLNRVQANGAAVQGESRGAVVPAQTERPPAPERQPLKEKVRTDGPIEGPEFARGVEPRLAPEARLPEISLPDLSGSLPASSYPDGSLNIGGEVRSAIIATDVYQSPDFRARVIARLAAGDKVSVEGSVGQWLRIRSRRGRAGFVLSQDVGELEDFRR